MQGLSLFVRFKTENKEKASKLGFNTEDQHAVFQVTPPDENDESKFLLANTLGELIWIPQDAILGVSPDFKLEGPEQPATNETPRGGSHRPKQNGASRNKNPYDDRSPVREGGYPPRSDTYTPRP